jgi:hypothetical protein
MSPDALTFALSVEQQYLNLNLNSSPRTYNDFYVTLRKQVTAQDPKLTRFVNIVAINVWASSRPRPWQCLRVCLSPSFVSAT